MPESAKQTLFDKPCWRPGPANLAEGRRKLYEALALLAPGNRCAQTARTKSYNACATESKARWEGQKQHGAHLKCKAGPLKGNPKQQF